MTEPEPKDNKPNAEVSEGGHGGHDLRIPPEMLSRYRLESDPDSERDIANYVEGQARDEVVQHVEKIKTEYALGERYEIWAHRASGSFFRPFRGL